MPPAKLTTWLADFKMVGLPAHPLFPLFHQPPNFSEVPKLNCRPCPQGGATPAACKDGHKSLAFGRLTAALPDNMRTQFDAAQTMQYLVDIAEDEVRRPIGYSLGTDVDYVNAEEPYVNFSDVVTLQAVNTGQFSDENGDVHYTVTVSTGSTDPAAIFRGGRRVKNQATLQGYTFYQVTGVLAHDCLIQAAGDSILAYKFWSRVERAWLDRAGHKITFEVDSSMSRFMEDRRQNTSGTPYYAINVWFYSVPKKFFRLVEKSEFYCRIVRRRIYPNQLDANGRILLKSGLGEDCLIAVPQAADTGTKRPASFKVLAERTDSDTPEDISSNFYNNSWRVQCVPLGTYDDEGKSKYKTWLNLGEKDYTEAVRALGGSLVVGTTKSWIVEYYAEVPPSLRSTAVVVSGRRCPHCITEWSKSQWQADKGVSTNPVNGRVRYCELMNELHEATNPGGTTRTFYTSPSGLNQFTDDCQLIGVCDRFGGDILQAPPEWRPATDEDISTALRDLMMSVTAARIQLQVGVQNTYFNYRYRRLKHNSVAACHGGPTLEGPTGFHPRIEPLGWGLGYVGDFNHKTTDGVGTVLDPIWGAMWDMRTYGSATFGNDSTYPAPGVLGQLEGWLTKVDALVRTYDSTYDPRSGIRNYFDRTAWRLLRDNAMHAGGRPLSEWVRIATADEKIPLEKVDWNTHADDYSKGQDRGDAIVHIFTTPQTAPSGLSAALRIDIKTLTTTGKSARGSVVTAEIHSAEIVGSDVKVHFKNQLNRIGYLRSNGMGDSWDEIVDFYAGGNVRQPDDFLRVNNFYANDHSIGGTTDKAAIGDSARINLTGVTGHPNFENYLWTLLNTDCFGPVQASDFGHGSKTLLLQATGYFQPNAVDMTVDGKVMPIAAAAVTLRDSPYTAFTPVTTLERPAGDLATITYWVDTAVNRIFFSNSEVDVYVDIKVKKQVGVDGSGSPVLSDWMTYGNWKISQVTLDGTVRSTYAYIDTMMTAADLGTFELRYGSTILTQLTGTPPLNPSLTQWVGLTDSNNHLVFILHLGNAGRTFQLEYQKGATSPNDPGDYANDACVGFSSLGYGRRMDWGLLADPDNTLRPQIGSLPGRTITITRQEKAVAPTAAVQAKCTGFQVDSYDAANTSTEMFVEHVAGFTRVWVSTAAATRWKASATQSGSLLESCFLIICRRFDYRAIFPVRAFNDAIDGIDSLSTYRMQIGGTPGEPFYSRLASVYKELMSDLILHEYLNPDGSHGSWARGLRKGAKPVRTLTLLSRGIIHDVVIENRWRARAGL